jgi:hypothetical protein
MIRRILMAGANTLADWFGREKRIESSAPQIRNA